jgi:hypothetical protein
MASADRQRLPNSIARQLIRMQQDLAPVAGDFEGRRCGGLSMADSWARYSNPIWKEREGEWSI